LGDEIEFTIEKMNYKLRKAFGGNPAGLALTLPLGPYHLVEVEGRNYVVARLHGSEHPTLIEPALVEGVEIYEKMGIVCEAISRVTGRKIPSYIPVSTNLVNDLGMDSLDIIEMTIMIEEKLPGSRVEDSRTARIKTIYDVVDAIT